jgi:hypothetical protein
MRTGPVALIPLSVVSPLLYRSGCDSEEFEEFVHKA